MDTGQQGCAVVEGVGIQLPEAEFDDILGNQIHIRIVVAPLGRVPQKISHHFLALAPVILPAGLDHFFQGVKLVIVDHFTNGCKRVDTLHRRTYQSAPMLDRIALIDHVRGILDGTVEHTA